MEQRPVCEITVTGTEDREWQGSVYFPDTGTRKSFRNLLELIRTVETATKSGQGDGDLCRVLRVGERDAAAYGF